MWSCCTVTGGFAFADPDRDDASGWASDCCPDTCAYRCPHDGFNAYAYGCADCRANCRTDADAYCSAHRCANAYADSSAYGCACACAKCYGDGSRSD